MDEDRCTLFSFLTGNMFAAILHTVCALSGWCVLVFPVFSALLFAVERHPAARAACLHTGVLSLAMAALEFVPTLIWLIILAVTKGQGAFFIIATILFAGLLLIFNFVLLVVEIACAVKAYKGQPVELPFITNWVRKIAHKL